MASSSVDIRSVIAILSVLVLLAGSALGCANAPSHKPVREVDTPSGKLEHLNRFISPPGFPAQPPGSAESFDDFPSASKAARFKIAEPNDLSPRFTLKSILVATKPVAHINGATTMDLGIRNAELIIEPRGGGYFYLHQVYVKPNPMPNETGHEVRTIQGTKVFRIDLGASDGPLNRLAWYKNDIVFTAWTNLGSDDAFDVARQFIVDK